MVATSAIAPTPSRVPKRLARAVGAVIGIGALLALLAVTSSLLEGPARTTVVLENPTAYAFNVHVRDAEGGNVLALGEVDPESRREFRSVIDQGDRWLFEFSYAGVDAGVLEATREEVEAGVMVIPDTVAEVLKEAGLAPPPQ